MKKKILTLLMLTIMTLSVLTACGGTDNADSNKSTDANVDVEVDTDVDNKETEVSHEHAHTEAITLETTSTGCDATDTGIAEGSMLSDTYNDMDATEIVEQTTTASASPATWFTWATDDVSATVTGLSGDAEGTDIVLPSDYNGLPVTSVAENAFKENTTLTSVVIPDSVTTIGLMAFFVDNQESGAGVETTLTSVTLSSNLTSIGNFAFACHANLTSVTYKATIYTSVTELTTALINDGVTVGNVPFHFTGLSD